MQNFDYVIVGGGSAGCVLANRLSENPQNRVCLLEAGPQDKSLAIDTPMGIAALIQWSKFNWMFDSSEQPALKQRKIYCPRGKGLGGSSTINAMMYVRGHPEDYQNWLMQGCEGWGWHDLLPYFIKSQHQERGGSEFHGVNGPLNVADVQDVHPISERFVMAAMQAGHPWNHDFNDGLQDGVGFYQTTIKKGKRHSAARAYLDPIKDRHNLTILTDCRVEKINFDQSGEQPLAESVMVNQGGIKNTISANKEIILSAGSFQSPQILMLSGIGDQADIQQFGIELVRHLPEVGKNLQEHADVCIVQRRKKTDTLSYSPLVFLKNLPGVADYFIRKRGPLSSPVVEAGGFLYSDDTVERPDLQIQFTPALFDDHGRSWKFMTGWGYSAHLTLLRPESRGCVKLASADPAADPLIDLNMLDRQKDLEVLTKGLRKIRQIYAAPAFAKYRGEEVFPGDACQSDQQIAEFLREKTNHVYHPVGTCRMGADQHSVVDTQLRVRGVQRLRVIDASVMPQIISGNTNAPVIAMAERAADLIQGKATLQWQEQADRSQQTETQIPSPQLEMAFTS